METELPDKVSGVCDEATGDLAIRLGEADGRQNNDDRERDQGKLRHSPSLRLAAAFLYNPAVRATDSLGAVWMGRRYKSD